MTQVVDPSVSLEPVTGLDLLLHGEPDPGIADEGVDLRVLGLDVLGELTDRLEAAEVKVEVVDVVVPGLGPDPLQRVLGVLPGPAGQDHCCSPLGQIHRRLGSETNIAARNDDNFAIEFCLECTNPPLAAHPFSEKEQADCNCTNRCQSDRSNCHFLCQF